MAFYKKGTFKTIQEHINESVFYCTVTGCWHWCGNTTHGYGVLATNYKTRRAHRAIYEHIKGKKLTPDVFLCHTCDNKLCVNPDHLFEGSHQDNMADMVSKKRQARGNKQVSCKLDEQKAIEIKNLLKSGLNDSQISRQFGVTPKAISHIRTGRNWYWVNG